MQWPTPSILRPLMPMISSSNFAFTAEDRLDWFQDSDLVVSQPPQDTADRCWRDVQFSGRLLAV